MSNQLSPETRSFSYWEGILLLLAFVVVSLVFAGFVYLVNRYQSQVSLPMLSIAGIVLLLFCLCGIAYIFARLDLQDKTQALGLPPGSIQAVIALSLIVLFAILSIFLFSSIGEQLRPLEGLTAAQRDELITKLGSGFAGWKPDGKGNFILYVRDAAVETRNDVGKQLIVLIGTLMTSTVSFYFGSRVAASTQNLEQSRAPMRDQVVLPAITKIEPEAGIARGRPEQVKITGTGFSKVDGVTIKLGAKLMNVSVPNATDTDLTFIVTIPQDFLAGDYEVVVTQGGKEISGKHGRLKVT